MHEHKHEHEHERTENGITVTHHEGAVIISAQLSLHRDSAVNSVSETLSVIAERIEQSGGIVGHVKASIENRESTMLSITEAGASCQIKAVAAPAIVKIAAIFYPGKGDEDVLEKQISEIISAGEY